MQVRNAALAPAQQTQSTRYKYSMHRAVMSSWSL